MSAALGRHQGEGAKTVFLQRPYANSLVALSTPRHKKIGQLVVDYFKRVAPKTVKVNIESLHGGQGYVCPIDLPAYKAAEAWVRNGIR